MKPNCGKSSTPPASSLVKSACQKGVKIGKKIPGYVSSWTDGYFHKSAFDIPIKYPNKKVIIFLSQFRKKEQVKLYRGVNKYNEDNCLIASWTYDRGVAERYIEDGGTIIEKEFIPEEILLDTTVLDMEQRRLMGYDYLVDDKEVLVII